jgi:hypothetical protein
MKYLIRTILSKKFRSLQWMLDGEDEANIQMLNGSVMPSQEALEAADLELQAVEYRDLRAVAYPLFGDQLDMMYHDLLDETTTWEDAIAAVKALYPKP